MGWLPFVHDFVNFVVRSLKNYKILREDTMSPPYFYGVYFSLHFYRTAIISNRVWLFSRHHYSSQKSISEGVLEVQMYHFIFG